MRKNDKTFLVHSMYCIFGATLTLDKRSKPIFSELILKFATYTEEMPYKKLYHL